MQSAHYPESLMRDYELLLSHFPSHQICRPYVAQAIREWRGAYPNAGQMDVLEIGPGYGETTELIVRELPGSRLTLVEPDVRAADILLSKPAFSTTDIRMLHEDATAWILECANSSFDLFTASWVLHNFPKGQRESFLHEAHRVLKPGGLFVIFDKVLPDDSSEIARLWTIHLARLKDLDTKGRPELRTEMLEHEERDAAEPYVWHERELSASMDSLGFENKVTHIRNERDIVFSAIRA